jgi:putative addiction module killer protein
VEARPREIRHYETPDGKVPFSDWMDSIEDLDIYSIIMNRLDRVEDGLFGEWRAVGKGVSELIINDGPGYRIYFGQYADFVILLCGGEKKTQKADIKKAQGFWEDLP